MSKKGTGMGEFSLSRVDLAGVEVELASASSPWPLLIERDDRIERAGNFRKSGVIFRVTDSEGQEVEWE
jgi:hypothetical protein